MKYQQLGKGIVKRREQRQVGLFIDGTGLDRATRRISRKVDMASLVRGVTSGTPPIVARYYTLIPYEDDSRQRAFLDAVARAGMQVIVKRLPPKGITRQVSVDPEMSADILAFSMGHTKFSSLSEYRVEEPVANDPRSGDGSSRTSFKAPGMFPAGSSQIRLRVGGAREQPPLEVSRLAGSHSRSSDRNGGAPSALSPMDARGGDDVSAGAHSPEANAATQNGVANVTAADPASGPSADAASTGVVAAGTASPIHRVVTVVCPGRDVSYAIALARELGADTVTADFGQFNTGDVLKSAAKWIDLSDSETIWRDA